MVRLLTEAQAQINIQTEVYIHVYIQVYVIVKLMPMCIIYYVRFTVFYHFHHSAIAVFEADTSHQDYSILTRQ